MTDADPEPPYDGPFVIVEPVDAGYAVRLQVPPGRELSRTCDTKDEAWGIAASVWRAFRLPLRDLCDGNVARDPPIGSRNSVSSL